MRKALPPGSDSEARERLLACATNLFHQKGYAATTVREIVEAAGVSKPVLYYYFGSKEGLYLEIVKHLLADFERRLETSCSSAGSARKRLLRLCNEMFSLFLERTDYVRLLYSVYYGPPQGAPPIDCDAFYAKLRQGIEQLVEEGIGSGEFRPINAEEMTNAILGALLVAIQSHLARSPVFIGNEGLARILDVIFSGLATRNPR